MFVGGSSSLAAPLTAQSNMAAVSQRDEPPLERPASLLGLSGILEKSISSINNLIIVRNKRWSALRESRLCILPPEQIVLVISSQ